MSDRDPGDENDAPDDPDIKIKRLMYDPPAEAYEATWREALEILKEAGPAAGFMLLVIKDEDKDYLTRFAMSTGENHIPITDMAYTLKYYLSQR